MKMFFIVSIVLFVACGQPDERFDNAAVNNNQNVQNVVYDRKEFDTLPAFDEGIYNEYIPQKLAVFLNEEMPDWKIPAPSNWDKFWFNAYITSNKLVNFVSGDFNCDKQVDYALILADKQNELSIWVFLSKKNSFEKIKLEDFGSGWEQIDFGLDVLEPGKLNYIDANSDTKPIQINCQSIHVVSFERSAQAYYWKKGKFKIIVTGD